MHIGHVVRWEVKGNSRVWRKSWAKTLLFGPQDSTLDSPGDLIEEATEN
jgi:hypothetical protein